MTVALVANIARPISSAISTAFSADSYGLLSSYGLLGASASPDAVIEALFANSEVGAWYDPSDLTTLFQDSAGTTPVTADGQPVGKILDKSGRGNHATQATAASRPLYKTDGTYHWLQFDGVDDSLSTAAINFSATDKMSVFSGVRKTSAVTQCVAELSSNINNNNGSFLIASGGYDLIGDRWSFVSRGTILRQCDDPNLSPQPAKGVLTGSGNISGDIAIVRVNGAQAAENTGDQGTGNYGNFPLYVGMRGGVSLALNGNVYSLIVRGALSTTQEITDTETWVNSKTGAY